MGKPDWKDAPEWAQWLAMDDDGKWYWYEDKPTPFEFIWESTGRYEVATVNGWEDTRERRP